MNTAGQPESFLKQTAHLFALHQNIEGLLREPLAPTEVRNLLCDVAEGCSVVSMGAVPSWIVMPACGGSYPKTRGQVDETAVLELLNRNMVVVLGDPLRRVCRLTVFGRRYYEHNLKLLYGAVEFK